MEKVEINTEYIKLDQLLKWIGEADNGVEAKVIIAGGHVKINGEVEKRRGRKVRNSDIAAIDSKEYEIVSSFIGD